MKLLVGSVFFDHIRSDIWYQLQIKYLRYTTMNFDHVVYLNGTDDFYSDSQVLKVDPTNQISPQHGHVRGLNFIIEYFNSHLEYDALLLLDSDSFPIQQGWHDKLLRSMDRFNTAAVVRSENLDTFAHPCVFFVKRPAAFQLKFGNFSQQNFMGHKFNDTSSNTKDFYPLLRTNKLNHHPILYGIYWHCFYHHGAGSRDLLFRRDDYLPELQNPIFKDSYLFGELVKDSEKFISDISYVPLFRKIKLC